MSLRAQSSEKDNYAEGMREHDGMGGGGVNMRQLFRTILPIKQRKSGVDSICRLAAFI